MKQEVRLSERVDYISPEGGMLFVRIVYILTTLVRAPVIAIGLILVAIAPSIQQTFSSVKTLDFTIYVDGTTHVFYESDVDPLEPDFTVELFGNTIDNFVAQDENGLLLSSQVVDSTAVIQTLGASVVKIDYDSNDIVTKDGKIWSFHVDSPYDYSLLMPKNTVIIGMSNYPSSLQMVDEQSLIFLPSGPVDINYFFGILGSAQTATLAIEQAEKIIDEINNLGVRTPLAEAKLTEATLAIDEGKYSDAEVLANEARNLASQEQQAALSNQQSSNIVFILIGGGIAAASGAAAFMYQRARREKARAVTVIQPTYEKYETLDKETIFRLKPNLRQDDKEMVEFIVEKGGQVYESELRKKFLQPRTTMWRAVKRLEREGIIEIEKKDQQNLVRLKKKLEGDQ
ncbi:MAG: helix-turn-helix transcriptional regulator [Nitrosopumilaceae archaeon]